jgi:hypothetical protein
MTATQDAVANWLPRRFVSRSAQSDRERFEQSYSGTLFLLVKLRSYSDPLALGLQSTCPIDPLPATAGALAGMLSVSGATAEATALSAAGRALSSEAMGDWIATPLACEPRFVVPVQKRMMGGRRTITVGRSYGSDIVLREQSVSKAHAHFEMASMGEWMLVDHDSKNLTRVNGTAVNGSSVVHAGDVVHFGRVEAKLCSATALWSRIAAA